MAGLSFARRRFLASAAAFVLFPVLARASSVDREDEIRAIEEMLVAPCCWRQQISIHDTPQAEAMRAEVRSLVLAGKSRDEVLAAFADKYGSRILASPPAKGVFLLGYLIPLFSLAVGAFSFAFLLFRSHPAPAATHDGNRLNVYSTEIEAELRAHTALD